MSIQSKKSQPLEVSVIIWIDKPTCERYGIEVQPGLRFNIFNDDQKVKIATVPAGSTGGVKAILHPKSICINWHRVPATIRRDRQPPKSVEGVMGAKADGIVQLAWSLPDWFFGPKEGK